MLLCTTINYMHCDVFITDIIFLFRSNERLAEANAKLLSERQRSKSLLGSSIINGSLGGPALDTHPPLGRLGLGASLLSPVGEQHTNRVETYLAKVCWSRLESAFSTCGDLAFETFSFFSVITGIFVSKELTSPSLSNISHLHSSAK